MSPLVANSVSLYWGAGEISQDVKHYWTASGTMN